MLNAEVTMYIGNVEENAYTMQRIEPILSFFLAPGDPDPPLGL